MNVALLRETFERIRPQAHAVALRFYERMFAVYPQVRPLFAGTDPQEQPRKLMATLSAVVAVVDRPDELLPMLDRLGRSHVDYGVQPEQYPYVTASLLATLAEEFGSDWNAEVAETWSAALEFVSARMIEAQRRAA